MTLTSQDLQAIDQIVGKRLSFEMTPLKKSIKKLEQKLDTTIRFFDKEVTHTKRRVTRIEKELKLSTLEQI